MKMTKRISKLSIRIFFLMQAFVVIPLFMVILFVKSQMEKSMQKELSDRVIQTISKNESYISDSLQNLAFYSNLFVYDEEFRNRIASPDSSALENAKYFQQLINRSEFENPSGIGNKAKVALFDNYGHVYSNWSQNFQNYDFLLQEKWVQESQKNEGHVSWSLFQPSYIAEDKGKNVRYISLSRAILSDITIGEKIATLVVSIDQNEFSRLLTAYAYPEDDVYLCIDDGEVLMKLDETEDIGEDQIHLLYQETKDTSNGELKKDINGKTYLISYYTFPHPWVFDGQKMKAFHFYDYQNIENRILKLNSGINALIVLVMLLSVMISMIVSRIIVQPVQKLSKQMENFQIGEKITGLDENRSDEIGFLNRTFIHMADRIESLFAQLKEENEIKERYHYETMRAQLNPHFLFNTLNTIRWMAIIRGADNIVEGIDALAQLLNYSMSREGGLVTVEDELENIRNYIYIHNIRYQDYVTLKIEMPEELKACRTLKFILQPIVENAIIHGFDKNQSSNTIWIKAEVTEEKLLIMVEDDGIGISEDVKKQFQERRTKRAKGSNLTGIGMTNVDACIRIQFGEEYGLRIENGELCGTKVVFVLPVIKGGKKGQNETNHDC